MRNNPHTGDLWVGNLKKGGAIWYDTGSQKWESDSALNAVLDSALYYWWGWIRDINIKDIAFDSKGNSWFGLNKQESYKSQNANNGGIVIFNKNGVDLANFPVGIENKMETIISVEIYPNPSNHFIYIHSGINVGGRVELYDGTGSLKLSKTIRSDKEQIDVSGLLNGIYYISVQGNDNKILITKKVIINR